MTESTPNRPPFVLRLYPHPSLSLRCEEVRVFGPHAQQLAKAMLDAMKLHEGVGLAANQMGQRERLFVMDGSILDDGQDLALFNPRLNESSQLGEMEEGCLSLPGVRYAITGRASSITVAFQDAQGVACERSFHGLAAVCAQHEMDHLDGLTMLDRLSPLKANRARLRLAKEAKARGDA